MKEHNRKKFTVSADHGTLIILKWMVKKRAPMQTRHMSLPKKMTKNENRFSDSLILYAAWRQTEARNYLIRTTETNTISAVPPTWKSSNVPLNNTFRRAPNSLRLYEYI